MAGEKRFENALKKWLRTQGIYPLGTPAEFMDVPPCGYFEKRWGGGIYTKSGFPDMRICVNGVALEVELKAEKGVLSELQQLNLIQINKCGGFGFVLYPEGFEAFKEIVKGVKVWAFNAPTVEQKSLVSALTNTGCVMLTG